MTIIKSKHFILRPFKKGDEKSLLENINNKKIYRNTLNIPYPYTLKDAKEWIAKNLKEAKMKIPTKIKFVIDIDGEVAGSIGLVKIRGHKAEIGYWLVEKHWDKGIMTEAVKLVTKFGFNKLKLKRIYAYVYPFNKASMRVLEKAGYKFEGILRKDVKKDNKFMDDYLFANVR
ncbi:GNAT family N-acetyltransferase [Patescibacteria group bacterium]|nr:GNAT family N-acetyltransferase [Patescibacteria group bacterium]